MKRIDDLKHDVQDISDNVLGDLDTEERIRTFVRETAEGNEERLEQLTDTAPTREYTTPDLEYLHGIKKLGAVSLQARHDLQTLYQVINKTEQTRDKQVALMLLNESLSRLSRGGFDIDEFGNFDAPDHADAEYQYTDDYPSRVAYLATKYRELWEDVPAEFLVDEDDRAFGTELFPILGVNGSVAYRDDRSGEEYNELEYDYAKSDVYAKEVELLDAVVTFRTRYHAWKLFAEEYLDVTFDEFLAVSSVEEKGAMHRAGMADMNEQLCENVLRTKQDYIEAYPVLMEEKIARGFGELEEDAAESLPDAEEIEANLDERARNLAEGIADMVDLPGMAPDASHG
jgi:hypothetical protein